MKKIQFIIESFKNLKQVGTILPSSKSIVKKMIDPINFQKDITILELGSGTGVITKKIIHKMNSNSTLICFEINKEFNQELKQIMNENMILINDSAEKINFYLNELKIEKVDYIISSVPLLTLPEKTTDKILEICSKIIGGRGKFVQLQYSKLLDKKIKTYFHQINIRFTLKYYLPSFIYICSNEE